MNVVSYAVQGRIGVISVNNPPVNALGHAVRDGVCKALEASAEDTSEILVLHCEGRTFFAGADITEFGKPMQTPSLTDMLAALEGSSKPVVAALHGTALGGGFETALACHYRIALSSAKVGLPEVKLGLLPGAGGTQRTPRLAGVASALELITKGNPIDAAKALSLNLIDEVADGSDVLSAAIGYAERLLTDQAPVRRVSDLPAPSYDATQFDAARQLIAKQARGEHAPMRIVDAVAAATQLPFTQGLKRERDLFLECLHDPQSAALRHLFFAEREAAKIAGLGRETQTRPINSVAIIGAGTMGTGIAINFLSAGIPTTLLELDDAALERGQAKIVDTYRKAVEKGRMSETQAAGAQALLTTTKAYADLATADLVIEAVFESMDVKLQVFEALDEHCKPGAILATNTSYLDINRIADATQRPGDVLGLHFFSPANIMRLLEVIRAARTSDEVLATAMQLARKIGKVPVMSGVCFGFIGNRMLRCYGREAQLCLIEGASPAAIDGALERWGMAMGPLAVSDLAGLDIGYKARQALDQGQRGEPASYRIADRLVELGRLGQKSGAGYYRYNPVTRARIDDPEVMEIVEAEAAALGITRRSITEDEIIDRLILAMVNEGFNILDEGIAQRYSDIDVVYAFGYGFPRFRGGPMHYADQRGLPAVLERLNYFAKTLHANHWQAAPLLESLVKEGRTLARWQAEQG